MSSFNGENIFKIVGLPNYLNQVDEELDRVLMSDNEIIRGPVLRLIKAKSKRIRPSILLATFAQSKKKLDKSVLACCVAIELVHIASLVHDDIVDNGIVRWGVPTINSKEGLSYAVMIGDYIFAKANQQAALVSAEVALIIAKTIEKLCDGEVREMTDQYNLDRSINSLLSTIDGKTAALVSAACELGGVCSNLGAKDLEALRNYGRYFGTSFQFVDDILDLISDQKILGKAVGNDVIEGVYTMPLLLAFSGKNSLMAKDLVKKKASNSKIVRFLINDGSLEKSIALTREYNILAEKQLRNLRTVNKNKLAGFPEAYFTWALSNLVDAKYQNFIKDCLN